MTSVVVDASCAVKWMIEEEWTAEATELLRGWTRDDILPIAPAWIVCEVSNVLFQRFRNHQIRLADAQDNLRDLTRLVAIGTFDPALAPRAMELAQTLGLAKTYDCLYLALAEQIGCELWTADEQFWTAVKDDFPRVKWVGQVLVQPPSQATTPSI